jgi:hypothetical protein
MSLISSKKLLKILMNIRLKLVIEKVMNSSSCSKFMKNKIFPLLSKFWRKIKASKCLQSLKIGSMII